MSISSPCNDPFKELINWSSAVLPKTEASNGIPTLDPDWNPPTHHADGWVPTAACNICRNNEKTIINNKDNITYIYIYICIYINMNNMY